LELYDPNIFSLAFLLLAPNRNDMYQIEAEKCVLHNLLEKVFHSAFQANPSRVMERMYYISEDPKKSFN